MLLVSPHFWRVETNEVFKNEMYMNVTNFFLFFSSFFMIVANTPWNSLIFPAFVFSIFQLRKGAVVTKWDVDVGVSSLMSFSDGLGCPCSVERWEERVKWRKKWMEKCPFFTRVGISAFDIVFCKSTSPYFHLDVAWKRLCFPPRKKYKQENWKYQNTTVIDIANDNIQSIIVFPTTFL